MNSANQTVLEARIISTAHFPGSMYPIVPGHELVGTVVEVGGKVTRVAVGDNVGVGCIRDSCLSCDLCDSGEECYCENGFTHTYNTPKKKVKFFQV